MCPEIYWKFLRLICTHPFNVKVGNCLNSGLPGKRCH